MERSCYLLLIDYHGGVLARTLAVCVRFNKRVVWYMSLALFHGAWGLKICVILYGPQNQASVPK